MDNAVLSCRCYGQSTDIGCEYLDGSEEGKFGYRGARNHREVALPIGLSWF